MKIRTQLADRVFLVRVASKEEVQMSCRILAAQSVPVWMIADKLGLQPQIVTRYLREGQGNGQGRLKSLKPLC